MTYFNYHAKAKKLIKEGQLINYEFVNSYKSISPALVLFFVNNKPMPIRQHMWNEYIELINNIQREKLR